MAGTKGQASRHADEDVQDKTAVAVDDDANKSTAQRDRERRMEEAKRAEEQGPDERHNVYAPYAVEGNDTSAYVGVNPEYMTYANETERPYRAGEGSAERWDEDQLLQDRVYSRPVKVEGEQTEGSGSSVPLIYPDVSGEDYKNVLADEKPKDTPSAVAPASEGEQKPASTDF